MKEGADTVAAFFAEPVMGAGGVVVPPTSYFDKIQQVLRKHDVLLVADEVICGFGRLGTMFGMETYGMKPDIVTVAKQISSGYARSRRGRASAPPVRPPAPPPAPPGPWGRPGTPGPSRAG